MPAVYNTPTDIRIIENDNTKAMTSLTPRSCGLDWRLRDSMEWWCMMSVVKTLGFRWGHHRTE